MGLRVGRGDGGDFAGIDVEAIRTGAIKKKEKVGGGGGGIRAAW